MRPEVAALLTCPTCGGRLARGDGALRCVAGHSFDIARQGYVHLLPGGGDTASADTARMVAARADVFDAGHMAPLTAAVVDEVRSAAPPPGAVADVGAGTGHHLAAVLDALDGRPGLAIDRSKHAARRAARAHPWAGAIVADAWARLPVRDGVMAVVLSIFAPRHGAEFARVLARGGTVVVVTPLSDHLDTIVAALGLLTVDQRKAERLERRLGPQLVTAAAREHRHDLALDHGAVAAVVGMGPSAHHVERDLADRIAALPTIVHTQVAVRIACYRHRDL
ncbi:MAG TPA: methyltransferase domain-containing protein [Euzebyales bacterium]